MTLVGVDSVELERFLANMAVVDGLERFAEGALLEDSVSRHLGLSATAKRHLGSPEGTALVGKWLVAFKPSLQLLRDFRSAEFRSTRKRPSQDDLRKVASASQEALQALVNRLEQRAAVWEARQAKKAVSRPAQQSRQTPGHPS
jgi:hypothetical protein